MSEDRKDTKSVSNSYTVILDPSQAKFSRLSSQDIDNDIKKQSEEGYINIVHDIVDASIEQLNCQNEGKKILEKYF